MPDDRAVDQGGLVLAAEHGGLALPAEFGELGVEDQVLVAQLAHLLAEALLGGGGVGPSAVEAVIDLPLVALDLGLGALDLVVVLPDLAVDGVDRGLVRTLQRVDPVHLGLEVGDGGGAGGVGLLHLRGEVGDLVVAVGDHADQAGVVGALDAAELRGQIGQAVAARAGDALEDGALRFDEVAHQALAVLAGVFGEVADEILPALVGADDVLRIGLELFILADLVLVATKVDHRQNKQRERQERKNRDGDAHANARAGPTCHD
ncbi:MAG: hypothetical protein IPM33_06705 [Phycisphaerales bacterium]|nr:hypothetical protein [Phycisphaerales bacterium]